MSVSSSDSMQPADDPAPRRFVSTRMQHVLDHVPAYTPGLTVPGSIKLASNESPYPPLPYVVERAAQIVAQAHRYPDNASERLRSALGRHLQIAPSRIRIGCGSVSLCTQLVQAAVAPGDEIVLAWHSFEIYPILAELAGATQVRVPLNNHTHDLQTMAARVSAKTRLVFVCNPNNPTGTAVSRPDLLQFLQTVPPTVLVVVDEAYREFVADPDVPSALDFLDEFPNLVVLRTFSKAYGLAGLRVGYAIAGDPVVADALSRTQVPFAVTAAAEEAALASLEPLAQRQMADRVAEITLERPRITRRLLELGYEVPPSQANFVWVPLADQTEAWSEHMAENKVIVRPFSAAGARVTIGTAIENDRCLAAAADWSGLKDLTARRTPS